MKTQTQTQTQCLKVGASVAALFAAAVLAGPAAAEAFDLDALIEAAKTEPKK